MRSTPSSAVSVASSVVSGPGVRAEPVRDGARDGGRVPPVRFVHDDGSHGVSFSDMGRRPVQRRWNDLAACSAECCPARFCLAECPERLPALPEPGSPAAHRPGIGPRVPGAGDLRHCRRRSGATTIATTQPNEAVQRLALRLTKRRPVMTMTSVLEPVLARDPGIDAGDRLPRPRRHPGRSGAASPCRCRRGRHPRHHHDDLRHGRPHRQGRVPGPPRSRHRARARRRHRGARRRGDRLRDRPARARRRHHAVRPVPRVPLRQDQSVRSRRRLRSPGRLAVRQHHRRRAGRVPAGAFRAGQPHPDPGRRHRRTGRPARRHRLHRVQRCRIRRRQDRRRGRRVRPGPDRAVRHGRREADGRLPDHRRRQRPGPPGDVAPDGRRRRARLHAGRRRRRGAGA